MKNYELLYLLPASLTGEEVVETFEEVRKGLEKRHATFLETLLQHPFLTKAGLSKEEESEAMRAIPVVKRRLAYAIKHENFGFYCLVNFSLEEKHLPEVDEYLRLHGKVLRHIITVAEPMTQEELDKLHTLFARKKAEQEKEEAEKNKERSEERKEREVKEVKPTEEKMTAEKEPVTAKQENVKAEQIEKNEPKPEKMETKTKAGEIGVEDATKESAKEEKPAEPAKKASKKNKIKLEELEDKLDAILEDTIV